MRDDVRNVGWNDVRIDGQLGLHSREDGPSLLRRRVMRDDLFLLL
jgi:hypothetical protein